MNQQFLNDVLEGLSKTPQKTLPSKYFYDKKGDELFVQIMAAPEYYLTNAEMDIFQNKTDEMISALDIQPEINYNLIELGAGDGTKTFHLLDRMVSRGFQFEYMPVDISKNALTGLESMLNKRLPELKVIPQQGDYFVTLEQLKMNNKPKIVLVLGSNIGNLQDHLAAEFIYKLGANLKKGDKIVLGVDLIKAKEIVLPAYNDAKGITAEFNLNLLDRINSELNGNFNRQYFVHKPYYEENEGIAKSFLMSTIKQKVSVFGKEFEFDEGETIQTEISRKYKDEIIYQILSNTDIVLEKKIMDSNSLFADYILKRN
jgi:L-histidine N-alpha-methyltransferase